MTRNKNSKLTPTKVNVRLASGRTIQAVRHKNLVPRPGASTPPAGPAVAPDQAEEVDGLHRDLRSEFDAEGFDKDGFDEAGFDEYGFDKAGFDKDGFDVDGTDADGTDREGFDKAGFNREGFDKDGFGEYGRDADDFNRDGFDSHHIHRETGNRFGPASYDRARDRGYSPDFDEEATRQMIHSVRGASEDDFPKGVDDGELVVRYHELLLVAAKEFPYDPIADVYIVGEAEHQERAYVTWGAWGEIEDKCFWAAAIELSDRAAERDSA